VSKENDGELKFLKHGFKIILLLQTAHFKLNIFLSLNTSIMIGKGGLLADFKIAILFKKMKQPYLIIAFLNIKIFITKLKLN